ncbi:MAG: response regulator [Chitinivibrionia bacterium]|nr:response regulator [Chitinivibrionia bacterium]
MDARDTAPFKILVVDDEPHILQILKFTLEKAGYQVFTAEDGEKALGMLEELLPDLVVLDIMMPKITGYEVCRKMREAYKTSHIPVILLTAKGELEEKIKGLEGGANDYLVKPYSNEELLLRVRNVLDWNVRQREANPLTGLPGNTAIERQLKRRIDSGKPFAFLYVDIDNFKGFNDYYGYQKGDEAIGFLAGVLANTVDKLGSKEDFIGHIGGDDFVMITAPAKAEFMARFVTEEFDKGALLLLSEDDVRRGYMEVKNRQGDVLRLPNMSVTIALVVSSENKVQHFAEINDIALELKRYGKQMKGSVVIKERRLEKLADLDKVPEA